MRPRVIAVLLLTFLTALVVGCGSTPTNVAPRDDYATLADRLGGIIAREIADKKIPAFSIALVDGDAIVWASGFGQADAENNVPATASTVYRVGSVSKLFTDIAVMQLVEKGEVDLDRPVTTYLPDFQPKNPSGIPITLRQLMCHRSGLVREPPVGHYFDPTEPTVAATVASLNQTSLVYKPEQRQKYSNAGITVVGRVLEKVTGKPFTACVKEAVLEPMGLRGSSFAPDPDVVAHLAKASMWAPDGRADWRAPTFELGIAPAGCMYSTVTDLSRFIQVLFAKGRGPGGQVVKPETLEAMWTIQYAAKDQKAGFGLGFSVKDFDGHRAVGHNGAIYGFSTMVEALPDAGVGVVAVSSLDVTNGVVSRIGQFALRAMLALRAGKALPVFEVTEPVDAITAAMVAGRYRADGASLDVEHRSGRVFLHAEPRTLELRRLGDDLVVDGRLGFSKRVRIAADAAEVRLGDRRLRRVESAAPPPVEEELKGLLGEYGWDHNVLFIHEKAGRLYSRIEWIFDYPLRATGGDVFAFPGSGLYHGEALAFKRDATGRATEVSLSGIVFKRREVGTLEGETFRIEPVKAGEALRRDALAGTPPLEKGDFRDSELVDLATLDPTIKFDIRYATTNNFMGMVFYKEPKAFMQRPAAEALLRVHRKLKEKGYGVWVFDAYRPWYVTKMFHDATPVAMHDFVADPQKGSRHNRGCAVDLTLYDLKTGKPIAMVAGYDEFSERAFPYYMGGTSRQRWHRQLLREVMEAGGFTVYAFEWWHFDYKDWKNYRIQNLTFDQINGSPRR